MQTSASSPQGRHTLRLISSPQALDFSSRLLTRGVDGILTFQEFVAVAREVVREQPEESALYLAALVALDMGAPDDEPTPKPSRAPSRN